MNWGDFKLAVRANLVVDGNRQGSVVQAYIDKQIRYGVIDLQRFIEHYRTSHTDTYKYNTSGVAFEGNATKITLPSNAIIRECSLIDKTQASGLLLQTVAPTAGGTGYTTATDVATTSNGDGIGAIVDIVAVAGVVTAITVTDAGEDYVAGDILTITGGGGNCTFTIKSSDMQNYGRQKVKCVVADWSDRNSMLDLASEASFSPTAPIVSLSPKGDYIYLWPKLVQDTYEFELVWDGEKIEFTDDANATPFDEETAQAVAYYVKAELDLQISEIGLSDVFRARYHDARWKLRQKNIVKSSLP